MIDLTLDAVFEAFGEPADALVTTPHAATAVEASIVWLPATTEDAIAPADPGAMRVEMGRRAALRELALKRSEVPHLPIGSVIQAADYTGGAVKTWIVDTVTRVEPDMIRVLVREVTT